MARSTEPISIRGFGRRLATTGLQATIEGAIRSGASAATPLAIDAAQVTKRRV
jgi:hypothetical protein